jgi:rhodopsin domain-containing protein
MQPERTGDEINANLSVCFISVVRVIFLADINRKMNPDFTYVGTKMDFLTLVEVNAGIVVACCLTLKPLINTYFPHWLATPRGAENAELTGGNPPTIGTRNVRNTAAVSGGSNGSNPELGMIEEGRAGEAEWEKMELWRASTSNGQGGVSEERRLGGSKGSSSG